MLVYLVEMLTMTLRDDNLFPTIALFLLGLLDRHTVGLHRVDVLLLCSLPLFLTLMIMTNVLFDPRRALTHRTVCADPRHHLYTHKLARCPDQRAGTGRRQLGSSLFIALIALIQCSAGRSTRTSRTPSTLAVSPRRKCGHIPTEWP